MNEIVNWERWNERKILNEGQKNRKLEVRNICGIYVKDLEINEKLKNKVLEIFLRN